MASNFHAIARECAEACAKDCATKYIERFIDMERWQKTEPDIREEIIQKVIDIPREAYKDFIETLLDRIPKDTK